MYLILSKYGLPPNYTKKLHIEKISEVYGQTRNEIKYTLNIKSKYIKIVNNKL